MQTKSRLAAAMTAALVSVPALADDGAAPPPPPASPTASWYLRNEVGGNLIPNISLKDKDVFVGADLLSSTNASISMDGGVAWNIVGGFRLNDGLSLEVGTGIAYNDFDSVSGTISVNGVPTLAGTTSVSGHLLQVPILVGPRAVVPVAEKLRLTAGLAIGGVYIDGDVAASFTDGVTTVSFDGGDSSWAFAYSVTLGLDWMVAESIDFGIAYRFLGTTSASFGPDDLIEGEGIYNQQILASLTVRF